MPELRNPLNKETKFRISSAMGRRKLEARKETNLFGYVLVASFANKRESKNEDICTTVTQWS